MGFRCVSLNSGLPILFRLGASSAFCRRRCRSVCKLVSPIQQVAFGANWVVLEQVETERGGGDVNSSRQRQARFQIGRH